MKKTKSAIHLKFLFLFLLSFTNMKKNVETIIRKEKGKKW